MRSHFLVTSLFLLACSADEADGPANCYGGKCDGTDSTANDPFKNLGDIETRQFEYRVQIEWCHPCEKGMSISGGRFLTSQTANS